MEQVKVTILKKDGDFYYRIRQEKKLVTVARIVRKTNYTSKIKKHEHKYSSFVNELNSVFAKWQKEYSVCYVNDIYSSLSSEDQQQLRDYLTQQLVEITEQLVKIYEEQKKQILQDFELNFDLMLQQTKDRLKKIKNTKLHQIDVEQDSI